MARSNRQGWRQFLLSRSGLREEREVEAELGNIYRRYANRVPRFIPLLGRTREQSNG